MTKIRKVGGAFALRALVVFLMLVGFAETRAQGSGAVPAAMATRGQQTVFACPDGSVWGVGVNENGSLGDGTRMGRLGAVRMQSATIPLAGAVDVACGNDHTAVLKADGTVWTAGLNSSGQLGNGNTTSQFRAVQVLTSAGPLTGVRAIAAGSSHTLALTKSGEVWSWGLNTSGQLGTGNTTNQNRAVKVASLPAVAAVSAGDQFSYAVAIDGTVWAFGDNSHGQLGNNSTVAISSTPVRVRTASGNLSAICEAAGGAAHGAFLSLNGTVWTAGLNSSGQLSTGTTTSSRVAQQALRLAGPLGGVSQVACSDNTTFFLLTSGKVLAAGDNTSGQVGDGTRASRSAAVLVSGLDGVSFLSAGADRCFAVITDGSIFAWGGDLHGAQARGERGLEWGWNSMPAWSPFFRVAMGVGHNLYLKSDGRVWAAGRNTFGQLGNGLAADSLFPVQVQSATGGLNGIQDVAAGRAHSLALGQNGTVWAWGLNLNGRLGDGTLINRSKAVMTHDAVGPLSGATAVVAGDGFNLALRQGAVWAWGANDKHQLGDGTAIDRNKAVRVVTASGGLAGVKAVAAGANHGVALAGNGSVWVWGSNSQGQLGLGNTINQSRAVTIPGVSDALAVGAGTAQTYILRSTGGGTVWGAGQNNFGQLADGTTTNRSGLVRVQDLTGPLTGLTWLKTGALAQQAAAGRLDGSSWIWGSNDTGQLGTGSLANALRAIRLPEGIQPQSLGTGATFARRADFEWVASGSFFDGQWGDGRKGYHATPTLVRGMTFARPAPDTDADGLADWREIAQGTSVVKSDTDGDGIGDASDILPIDYFNGAPVALAMASGNQQTGKPGTRLAKPIVVVVSRYGTPLSNAPVTFSVTSGGLAADGNGTVLLGQLQVRTNAAGQAIVFYTLPAMERTCSISIHAGNARTTAIATASWIPATPALSLPGGTFATQRWVVATSATPDARIHYTLDGKEPTSASPHIANGQAILVDRTATLKVRAIATSGHSSPVVSGSFQITGMVSAGAFHMAGLCTDGTVWAWGNNGSGQVGAGLGGKYPVPFRKNGIANGRHLSCGGYHTLVLLENGEVVSFGRNHEGQLGHSAEGESVVPGLQGIQTVAAGGYHSLALKSDGTVWAWGANWFGQLGDGSTQSRALPVPVRDATGQPLRKVAALAAGSYSSYALLEDGTLLAWGGNWNGQLGDGSQENRTFPVRVGKLEGVTRVAAGWEHAAAVKSNGTVWCWGDGASGQIGGDSFQMGAVTTPVQAAGITTARLVAAGSSHTLALLSDGSLRAWGNNFSGQLGSGVSSVTSIRSTPQKTVFEGGVVDVSAGGFDSMALLADGTLRTFGYNEFGQLGAGDLQAKPYAFASQARAGVAGVSAGKSHSAIRFADGRAGWFGFYETGNRHIGGENPDDQRHQARVFDALTGVRQVASGHNHSLALKNDGTVWAWGMGGQGQLGTGHTGPSMEPVQVPGMNGVVWVSAAGNSSLAVKADGSVCTWGENSSGQLGDGTQLSRWHPTTVVGLSGILQAELSPSHGVAVSGNGTVHIWGNNESANLSAEAARAVLPPRVVPNLSAVAVAAGEGFTLALAADGTVRSWGANQAGQLGLGDALLRGTPTLVPNVAAIVQVVAKGRFAMALKQDGTALAWGQNGFGQLGDGTLVDRPSPVPVANLDSVGELAAGANQSFAVLKNGTLRAWGNNGNQQLGRSNANLRYPANRLILDPLDANRNAVPDAWEISQFGNTTTSMWEDPDYDGLSTIEEYHLGTNPKKANTDGDLFSDIADPRPLVANADPAPVATPIGGNNQRILPGAMAPEPLEIFLTLGSQPAANMPVIARITGGGGKLAATADATVLSGHALLVHTDAQGKARVHLQAPASEGTMAVTFDTLPAPLTFQVTAEIPVVTATLDPGSVTEDGVENLLYTFHRAGAASMPLAINFSVGGNATFGTDYMASGAISFDATTGSVAFAANATTATVAIDPTGDPAFEANESVALTLTPGGNYTVGTPEALTGTILNDDLPPPAITSALSANATVGVTFTYQITASNNATSYSASGLPAGLTLDAATGHISGTPEAAGDFEVTLGASNSGGTGSATLALAIAHTRVISLSGNLSFGYVGGNKTATRTLSISNGGTGNLTVTGITYPAGFSANFTGDLIVAPKTTRNVTVTFKPTSPAPYAGTLEVLSNASSGNATIALSGTGAPSLPDSFSGLRLWLRADEGVAKDTAEKVSGWTDQSASGHSANQSGVTQQPLWISSALNGRPVVRFDGDDFLTLGSSPSLATGNFTFFVVASTKEATGNQTLLSRDAGAGANNKWIYQINGSRIQMVVQNPQNYQYLESKDFARVANKAEIFSLTKAARSYQHFLSGTMIGSKTADLDVPEIDGDFRIGRAENDYYLRGDMAEVLIYDRVLSIEERQTVESYLALKYALPIIQDSDGDGMPDEWEVTNGLNPLADDTLEDQDGDRVPNIFEFRRGTQANDAASKPPATFVVNPATGGASKTDNIYATIQEAVSKAREQVWNSATGQYERPNAYSVIEVKAGSYEEEVTLSAVPMVLLGELGAQAGPARILGRRDRDDETLELYSVSVVDGFEIGKVPGRKGRGVIVTSNSRLVNCVIRGHESWQGPGISIAANLDLVHCTVLGNKGATQGRGIYMNTGTLNLINSIVWGSTGPSAEEIYKASGTINASTSIVSGGEHGGWNVNPQLTPAGWLKSTSPAINRAGTAGVANMDIHGENRPNGEAPDLGADEYRDADGDSLPDFFEIHFMGNLSSTAHDDNDGDRLTNDYEYVFHFDPLSSSSSGNVGGDLWAALSSWGAFHYPAEWLLDPDGDGLPNWAEIWNWTDSANPDTNRDGISDGLAVALGLSATSPDTDGDGILNEQEIFNGTNPSMTDTDGDGVGDSTDAFPLDARRSDPLPEVPDDATAPGITLNEPVEAVLVP